MLADEREKLFSTSKKEFQSELIKESILKESEKLDIQLIKRTGRATCKNVVKDLIDLFLYAMDLVKVFPRSVLAKNCKYIDTNTQGAKQKQKQDRAQDKYAEVNNVIRDLKDEIQQLVSEWKKDREKIVRMEYHIVQLQGKVACLDNQYKNTTCVENTTEFKRNMAVIAEQKQEQEQLHDLNSTNICSGRNYSVNTANQSNPAAIEKASEHTNDITEAANEMITNPDATNDLHGQNIVPK